MADFVQKKLEEFEKKLREEHSPWNLYWSIKWQIQNFHSYDLIIWIGRNKTVKNIFLFQTC
jgi:hypothetical protein